MCSQMAIISLFVIMANGSGTQGKSADDIDIIIPVLLLVATVHVFMLMINSFMTEHFAAFSEFDGGLGYMVILIRVALWVWFFISAKVNYTEKTGMISDFAFNLCIVGTFYILS